MMRILALLSVALSVVSVPSESRAFEDHERKLLYHLAATPAYLMLQTTLHEGAHAGAGVMFGYRVSQFKPYPHMADMGNGETQLVGGVTSIDGEISDRDFAWICIAPSLTNLALLFSTDLALAHMDSSSHATAIMFMAGMMWTWSDFVGNTLPPFANSDIDQFNRVTGTSAWIQVPVVLAISAFTGWRVLARGRDVFSPRRRMPEKADGLRLSGVAVMQDAPGMMLAFRF